MKSIYNIAKEYIDIIDELENNNGEITPEIETALAINETELQQKSVAYVSVIKSLDAEVEIIDNELKRLQALKKARNTITSNLKERLSNAMQQYGIDEIKTELVKINFRKSKSVNIFDESQLPMDCKIVQVIPISKTELKKRIDSGEDIPGVEILDNLNLQIK